MPFFVENLEGNDDREILWLSRMFALNIYQNKLVKTWIYFLSLSGGLTVAFQTCLFLQKFDKAYFMQYCCFYGCSIFILICCFSLNFITEEITLSWDHLKTWKIHTNDIKLQNQIRREALYINCFLPFNTALAQIAGIYFFLNSDVDITFLYPLKIIDDYFSPYKTYLVALVRLEIITVPLLMIGACHQIIYMTKLHDFQMYMFMDNLQNLNHDFEVYEEPKMFYDDGYQSDINSRLKFCFNRYQHLHQAAQNLNNKLNIFIVLYSVGGAVLFISVLGGFFFLQDSSVSLDYLMWLRLGFLSMVALFTTVNVVASGQQSENISNQVFEVLIQSNWYCWNQENKNVYLMFLLRAINPYRIKFTENIYLNYKLGVAIYQNVFSVVSVIYQLRKKEFSG